MQEASFAERSSFEREASRSRSRSRENVPAGGSDNFQDRYAFVQWRRREWDPVESRAERWRGLLNVIKNWVYDYAVWVRELAGWVRTWNNGLSLEEVVIEGLDARPRPRDYSLAEADEEYASLLPLLEEGLAEFGDQRA